jgi:hypothetical protein
MKNPGVQYWAGFRLEALTCWPGPVIESARRTGAMRVQCAVTTSDSRMRRHCGGRPATRSSPRAWGAIGGGVKQVHGGRGSPRWPIIDDEAEVAVLRWLSSTTVGSCNSKGWRGRWGEVHFDGIRFGGAAHREATMAAATVLRSTGVDKRQRGWRRVLTVYTESDGGGGERRRRGQPHL